LIITSKIKLKILGHVQSFSKKYMDVHHIHRLLYKQYEVMYENNCLLTEKSTENASEKLKSLKRNNSKKR